MVIKTKTGSYPDSFAKYLRPTKLANYDYGPVKKVANTITKDATTPYQVLTACWEFVRDLPIGFDRDDSMASTILANKRGMCNTKTTLFTALARCAGLPVRTHAYAVDKSVHKGSFPLIVYLATPKTTLFTYPEVYYKDEWMLLSQAIYSPKNPNWDICPFDDADGRDIPLKDEWISKDHGVFWHPDNVYDVLGTNMDSWRGVCFPLAQLVLNKSK